MKKIAAIAKVLTKALLTPVNNRFMNQIARDFSTLGYKMVNDALVSSTVTRPLLDAFFKSKGYVRHRGVATKLDVRGEVYMVDNYLWPIVVGPDLSIHLIGYSYVSTQDVERILTDVPNANKLHIEGKESGRMLLATIGLTTEIDADVFQACTTAIFNKLTPGVRHVKPKQTKNNFSVVVKRLDGIDIRLTAVKGESVLNLSLYA